MNTAARRTWTRLHTRLRAGRHRAGLPIDTLAARTHIDRTTIRHLENGRTNPHIDTTITYAHAVGLDLAAVPPHLAALLDLDHADIVAVLRAAQAAADGHRLNPLQARRITGILAAILTPPTEVP